MDLSRPFHNKANTKTDTTIRYYNMLMNKQILDVCIYVYGQTQASPDFPTVKNPGATHLSRFVAYLRFFELMGYISLVASYLFEQYICYSLLSFIY